MPCNQLLSKYIAITFHNNLTEATVANELIMSVQSLNYSTKSCLISWPARLVKAQDARCGFRFWSITRNAYTLVIDVESQQQEILTDIVHSYSGVTYPYLMKQDFFSLRISHENSLRLLFYFQFVIIIMRFSVYRIFPMGNEGKCQIALHTM